MVSNISMMQKVMISVTAVKAPMFRNPLKSSLNRVVFAMSAKGGRKDAPAREAKGLVCRKMASPPQ